MTRLILTVCAVLAWAVPVAAQQEIDVSRIYLGLTGSVVRHESGSGSPEGVITAPVNSQYIDATTGLKWRKATGSGSTGWTVEISLTPCGTGGQFVRSTGSAWGCSTLVLPNAAAAGDVPYGSASNTLSMLTIGGTEGMFLRRSSGGLPGWSTLVMPNAATANQIVRATATNTYGGDSGLTYDGTTFNVTGDARATGRPVFYSGLAPAIYGYRDSSGVGWMNANSLTGASGLYYMVGTTHTLYSGTTPMLNVTPNGIGINNVTPASGYAVDASGQNIRITSANQAYYRAIRASTSHDAAMIFGTTAGSATNWLFGVLGASLSGNTGFHLYDSVAGLSRFNVNLSGDVGIGTGTATSEARLHVQSTTQQCRFGYDASNYFSCTVDSNGVVALDAVGTAPAFTFADALRHPSYTSQASNWAITADGQADFRYLFADEMRIKLFSAEEQAVYRASLMVTPSYSEVSQAFTCPAAGATSTLWVRDAATLADARVFTANNWVVIRVFTRADADADGAQELTVGDCVGQVSSYADGSGANAGQQSWTFTRGSGGNAGTITASSVVPVGNVVLDFGTANNGVVEVSAYDGAEGVNAPYIQTKRWATSPVAANFSVTSRLGKTTGITGTANEFGLFAGAGYSTTDGQYILATNNGVSLHGIDLTMWDGSTEVFKVRRNAGDPYLALGSTPPSAFGANAGIFLGWTGTYAQASFYTDANNYWQFDGTKVTWKAANTTLDSSGNLTATSANLSGDITANTGRLGGASGWVIDTGAVYSGGGYIYLASGAANVSHLRVGDGGSDSAGLNAGAAGSDIAGWAGASHANRATAPFRYDLDGNVWASSLTAVGDITANTGRLGGASGWVIDTGAVYSGGGYIYLASGAANVSHLRVGDGGSDSAGLNAGAAGSDIAGWAGASHANRATAPFRYDLDGNVWASSLTAVGDITANTGRLGGASGWVIAANTVKDVAGLVGLDNTVTGGNDCRIWAGHATCTLASFRVYEDGSFVATNGTFTGDGAGVTNINGTNIQTDTVTASQIAANAITASELNADSVTSAKIAANTIVAGDIAAATITTTEIAANTITAADIAAGTITATELAADSVTAAKIDVATLSAIVADTGALTVQDSLTVGTSGVIKSGATAFSTGTGYWLAYNGGTPQFRVGDAGSGPRISWDGSEVIVRTDIINISDAGIFVDVGSVGIEIDGDGISMDVALGNGYAFSSGVGMTGGATSVTIGGLNPVAPTGSVLLNADELYAGTGTTADADYPLVQSGDFAEIRRKTDGVNGTGGCSVVGDVTVERGIVVGVSCSSELDNLKAELAELRALINSLLGKVFDGRDVAVLPRLTRK